MKFKWKILDVLKESGSILVKYYEPELYETGITYNIDLPITNGKYPSKEEIIELISNYIPTYELERQVNLRMNAPNMKYIEDMIDKEAVDVNEIPFVIATESGVEFDVTKTVTQTTLF